MIVLEVVIPIPLNKNFYYIPPKGVDPKNIVGKRIKVQFGNKILTSYAISYKNIKDENTLKLKQIIEIVDKDFVITKEIIELANYISKNYICSLGEALASIVPVTMKPTKRTIKNKIIDKKDIYQKHVLNVDQINAINLINTSLGKNSFVNFLLHGVTASGKTEVYINTIEYALEKNKNIIILVPEISLTIQFADIMTKKFGTNIGLWHSNINNTEKYNLFLKMKNEKINIIMGARSAIFAPFKNIGLIIIDEEHEQTYKQEQKPCYDTREIAKWRGKYHNAVIVFGSATPSLESYKDALEKKLVLIELNKRINKKKLPEVKILSLKNKQFKSELFAPETIEIMSKTLLKGEQIIVFLNRRGYSQTIMCRKCSNIYQCQKCSISMVFHKNPNLLKCHYCGETKNFPITCPICNSKNMLIFGTGTQKVEAELIKLLKNARIFRLDGDTASSKNNYEKAYIGMKNEKYNILLGTQMIAKGFDFPKVSLVCVADADTLLYIPNFKSVERTFQLITQVSGRSGRGTTNGTVIIQTNHPQHYAIKCAKNHDFLSFYKIEIEQRKKLFYPPYCSIVKISIKNKNEKKADKISERFFSILTILVEKYKLALKLLGPSTAYIPKINNIYRKHIIIKGCKENIIKLIELLENSKQLPKTFIKIEIMPSDLI